MSIGPRQRWVLIFLLAAPLVSTTATADDSEAGGFVTLEESGIECNAALQPDDVLVLDLEGKIVSADELSNEISKQTGQYALNSNRPVLIPKFFTDGKTRRQWMVRHAQQEVAATGCNLLVVLGVEFVEKQWEDPSAIRSGTKRWVTMGYALVLVGSH